jgi:autotransporter passenger strand-loop-strand repeat protein
VLAVTGGGPLVTLRLIESVPTFQGGTADVFGQITGSGRTTDTVIVSSGLETVSSGGTGLGTMMSNGGHEVVSSGAIADDPLISSGGTLGVVRSGTASGTTVLNGGHEIVSSGGFEAVATLNGSGTLEVSSGGSVGAVDFGSGGILQLDALMAFGGAISGFPRSTCGASPSPAARPSSPGPSSPLGPMPTGR